MKPGARFCPSPDDELTSQSTFVERAQIPTPFGLFEMLLFRERGTDIEHVAMVRGIVADAEKVLVRVHSECITGDLFGSLRCDCGDQLRLSLQKIQAEGRGVVVYLRQEGRGIGLANKLKAYNLQDHAGLDTVAANIALGFRPDERGFRPGAEILRQLEVRSVRLMTNNPGKVEALEKCGIRVVERVPVFAEARRENAFYLRTKAEQMGHDLPNSSQALDGDHEETKL
ncbi:GTP cyclohydrolase II [Sphingopyxis sp. SE2]|uniref:GTP cyclohydrolase II n=1 Tax=Sphingopyxis sp. SE2 TaxID=1586240 RepID=UPI0028C35542|nr:GTP cyclohydrolase II [Sphingopyxis sp. SE2]MDT7531283.1 GTP cyclohydrolase II [Sphingopyxis sp. SE2]